MKRLRLHLMAMVALVVGLSRTADAQWALVGYVGETWTASSAMTLDDGAKATAARVADVGYESRAWDRPLYGGVRAGRTVSADRRWSIELEYIHLKVYASRSQVAHVTGAVNGRTVDDRRRFDTIVERFQLSHGLNFFLANVAFAQRIHPRVTLSGRAGIGPTLPHVEATVGGVSRDEYTWGRIGLLAGAGVDVYVTGYLFLTGELKGTFTLQHLAVGSTMTKARFATAHVVGGFGIRLGS